MMPRDNPWVLTECKSFDFYLPQEENPWAYHFYGYWVTVQRLMPCGTVIESRSAYAKDKEAALWELATNPQIEEIARDDFWFGSSKSQEKTIKAKARKTVLGSI